MKADEKITLLVKEDQTEVENLSNEIFKWISIAFLILQNSSTVVCLRLSRIHEGCSSYVPSAVVLTSELLKLMVCLLISLYKFGYGTPKQIFREISLLFVPALCFSIQDILQFIVADRLEAILQQMFSQLKIITTAFFAIFILKRHLTALQWFSLLLLMFGIVLANASQNFDGQVVHFVHSESELFGIVLSILISCLSGFSTVYLEKYIKKENHDFHIQNVQLSILMIPMQIIAIFIQENALVSIQKNGFFYGFCKDTVILTCLLSFGGIITGSVIKFANNDWKNMSNAFSIVLSSVLCHYLFKFEFNLAFMSGTLMILVAIITYNNKKKCHAI